MGKPSPWDEAIGAVQSWLLSQGTDPDAVRCTEPEALSGELMIWGIHLAGVDVFIQLERTQIVHLRVYAPFPYAPADKPPALLAALLRLNAQGFSASAIGLDDDGDIIALQDRPAAGLEGAALGELVRQVAGFTAHCSQELARRFAE